MIRALDHLDGRQVALKVRPVVDEQAAQALEHLHTHDPPVVHGDVKPANLILTSSGRIVLVDFGLSSTPADEPRRAGTAGYAAPELAAGARPTASSDVYSLAASAGARLSGGPPAGGAPALVARLRRWWGDGLPRGAVTLVVADVGLASPRDAE